MKHRLIILITGFILITNIFASPHERGINAADISSFIPKADNSFLGVSGTDKALGWIENCNNSTFCDGCYSEVDNIVNNPNPRSFRDAPVSVKASKPAFFTKAGTSVVQGDVKLTQPGREIEADHVTFFRDNKTGKINRSILIGNVTFRESGKLIVAEQGNIDFFNKIYVLHQGIYRLLADTPTGLANVWGRAKKAVNEVAGVLKLTNATYSACPPNATSWYIRGSQIDLNRNIGRGEVTNAVVFFKKVPVFYAPYFNFSIDKHRKSGFLLPTPSHSSGSGYGINLPYYFNLAPNYDATFTPQIFSKRGVLFNGLFRFLTATSTGTANFSYIPRDSAFVDFRDSAVNSKLDPYDDHAFRDLKESSSGRGLISLQNRSHFGDHWQGAVDVNYSSDDYFLQDFGGTVTIVDNDQLLNRADISYSDYHWNFLGRLQGFQTLHPITHRGTIDQYQRLPQLNLAGDFPGGWGGLNYRLESEIVNFMHRDDFYGKNAVPITAGSRFNLMPSVSAPLNWLGGYVIPTVQLQGTGYNIHDQIKKDRANSITRLYPAFSVDSGIVLNRDIVFLHKKYTQTLEPRVFYLLVPTRDQDHVPVFDTYLPSFDFSQLFRTNRFSGIDRVGDANQVALAVTTRFLDEYGQEKFNAGVGQIVVIHKHQITLDKDSTNFDQFNEDPLKHENLSPMVGRLQYFIYPKMNATFDMAWDPSYHRLNTLGADLQYIESHDRVVNFGYHYVLHGDQDPASQEKHIDLSRIGFSVGWKIWQHWNIIGSINYNVSYKRAQSYVYGLEYNSCCWAVRLAHSRNFRGVGTDNQSNYDSNYYVQFSLKGLSDNLDLGGLEGMLASQISGYRGKLATGV